MRGLRISFRSVLVSILKAIHVCVTDESVDSSMGNSSECLIFSILPDQ